jgi:hypothetical protein
LSSFRHWQLSRLLERLPRPGAYPPPPPRLPLSPHSGAYFDWCAHQLQLLDHPQLRLLLQHNCCGSNAPCCRWVGPSSSSLDGDNTWETPKTGTSAQAITVSIAITVTCRDADVQACSTASAGALEPRWRPGPAFLPPPPFCMPCLPHLCLVEPVARTLQPCSERVGGCT